MTTNKAKRNIQDELIDWVYSQHGQFVRIDTQVGQYRKVTHRPTLRKKVAQALREERKLKQKRNTYIDTTDLDFFLHIDFDELCKYAGL